MTRRWFLGAMGGALIGATTQPDEPMVKLFESVQSFEDGDITTSLDVITDVLGRCPLYKFTANLGDFTNKWNGWTTREDRVHVYAEFLYGGRMSFVEDTSAELITADGTRNIRFHPRRFFWKIGQLPVPPIVIDFLPVDHRLTKWVKENNRVAVQNYRGERVPTVQGALLIGGRAKTTKDT